jgi:DNA-binding NtrC family response regulator
MHALIDRILQNLRDDPGNAAIEVVRDFSDDVSVVQVDGRQIEQVFLNLVLNAIQAMQHRGRVTISTRAGHRDLVVSVADSGPGIRPDAIAHIFQPFFTTRSQGTGLGLAIVKKIVEAHGGRIEAASPPGSGAVFTVTLEDEKLLRMTLRKRLEDEGYQVFEAETGRAALELIGEDEDQADLLLLDFKLPDMTGIDVLRRVRELHLDTSAILLTAFSSINSAVEAMKLGAHDYLNKPIDFDELLATIAKALETTRLRREVRRHRNDLVRQYGITNIVGRSKATEQILMMVRKVADSAASTVLIRGESGTGKDVVAKAIHYASGRAAKPFMNITCTALTESLLESEMFGHERGAFTDAKALKKGLLEAANGGTVFLDEIGDMGAQLQSKVLRFLEEKTFKRVGGSADIRVDVRVIAATNRDLEKMARAGTFREDLFYRLNVVPIELPPLRERKDDIPDLVHHFLETFNREFKKHTRGVTPEAMACLTQHDWPGNVRELRNVIERVMILEDRDELDVTDLPEEILEDDGADTLGAPGVSAAQIIRLPEEGVSLHDVQYELVRQALERTGGNQSKAARLLRISRDALRYRMKTFGLG